MPIPAELHTASPLKLRVAQILTADRIGRPISRITRGQIRHQGLRIDASGSQFTDNVRAQMFWGLYEAAETRMIRRYLSGSKTVVELGSSLGVTSAHIASIMAPHGRLICVEANPSLAPLLLRATLRYGAHGLVVRVVHAAIADHDGEAQLQVARRSVSSKLWLPTSPAGEEKVISVPALTLRTVLEQHDLTEFDLVSDIEGAEAAFLLHDSSVLRRCRRAVLELHDTACGGAEVSVSDLLDALCLAGFRLVEQYGPVVAVERV